MPTIHPTAFVHDLAYVTGNVTLGPRVSVWPFVSIRGDNDAITIGEATKRGGPGTLAVVPARTEHHVKNTGSRSLFFVTIYSPPQY